jgi:hypothetical protein
MAVLKFSLAPAATAKVHELLVCLAKFGETVAIEARKDKVSTRTSSQDYRNISRDAYELHTNDCLAYIHRAESVKNGIRIFRSRRDFCLPQL